MTKPKSKSQTIERAFLIFDELMIADQDIPALAERCKLTYSTTYRIVQFLADQGYVQKTNGKKYKLGSKLIQLGFRAYDGTNLVRSARSYLEALNEQTQDTVHLAVRESGQVVYLDKLAGYRAVNISSSIGGRKNLHNTGVGKALLLLDTPEQWAEVYEREGGHPAGKAEFLANMQRYARGGYALDLGEDSQNIRCVAAPIWAKPDRLIAAISVSSTVEYMNEQRIEALIETVKNTAATISSEVYGFRPE
jgi:Transcriptional regulator